MNRKYKGMIAYVCVFFFFIQIASAADAQNASMLQVRFSQRPEAVRLVFDLDKKAQYTVKADEKGTVIVMEFTGIINKTKLSDLPIKDVLVKRVNFTITGKDTFRATIELARGAAYKVGVLSNPDRVFIDLIKNIDQKIVKEIEPGLRHVKIVRSNEQGMLTANVLDIDLQYGYRLRPVLANDKIAGRETLSAMAKRYGAIGAVNASYFQLSGEILGLTKIDSKIVSTTYLARSAFGIAENGEPIIDKIDYQGTVKFGKGTVLPISGVNVERGENALILYNDAYDASTKTNVYGKEYTVQDGHVVDISQGNTRLAQGSIVLSAHGTNEDKMAAIQLGDIIEIKEDLGIKWNTATQILGVGPMLLKDDRIYLTTKEEQFGADVSGGRAPRTAVGITKDNHVLLVVVDGRQNHSKGCTLLELAILMQELGAKDAVNFDGGGSTEMVLRGEIVNSPSDGKERHVGSSLVILPKSN